MTNREQNFFDLLQQAGFKEWVLHPNEASNQYWHKWMDNHPEQAEAVAQAREFILRMRFKEKELSASEIDSILDNIIANQKDESPKFSDKTYSWKWLKVAAVLALMTTFSIIVYRFQFTEPAQEPVAVQYITKANPSGQKSQLSLPDGTRVKLNANSKLTFPATFSDTARIVQLSGEAFFDVVKDASRPFRVKSEKIVTTALGTSFNIRAYPESGRVHVALLSGKVTVRKDTSLAQAYLLEPGEKIMYDHQSSFEEITPFDSLLEVGWKEGILIFENSSFPDFLEALERWYGVEFLVEGKPHQAWQIEGKFKHESLEEILKGLSYTHAIEYEINGKQVTIKL